MADEETARKITLHVKTSKVKESIEVDPNATIKEVLLCLSIVPNFRDVHLFVVLFLVKGTDIRQVQRTG